MGYCTEANFTIDPVKGTYTYQFTEAELAADGTCCQAVRPTGGRGGRELSTFLGHVATTCLGRVPTLLLPRRLLQFVCGLACPLPIELGTKGAAVQFGLPILIFAGLFALCAIIIGLRKIKGEAQVRAC